MILFENSSLISNDFGIKQVVRESIEINLFYLLSILAPLLLKSLEIKFSEVFGDGELYESQEGVLRVTRS